MNNFLDFINEDIEAKKTLLSSMPTNNKTNAKKYNEKIDSTIDTYNEYKENVKKYLKAKSESFEDKEKEISVDEEALEKKVKALKHVVVILNPLNTYVEKLEIDDILYDLKNYSSISFDSLNDIINRFIDIFDDAGIKLDKGDFNTTFYVHSYMTTFFKLRSQKSKDYSELSDVFEKIYWFNPEIIEHIELNFRRLIKKNDKVFKAYISKLAKSLMEDYNIEDYEEAKKKYKDAYNELQSSKEESVKDIIELAKKGSIDIKNYFEDSKYRTSTYEILIINHEEKDENRIYKSLEKLKQNALEYRNYTKYKAVFDSFKAEYPANIKEFDNSKLKELESSINEKEEELEKINKKIFAKNNKDESKLLEFVSKKIEESLKKLKIESIKLAKEIYDLYQVLDKEKIKEMITPNISSTTLIDDVLKIYASFNLYRKSTIEKALKIDNYNDVLAEDKKFKDFAANPNNIVINGIYLYEDSDVPKIITNKYRFENINVQEDELSDNIDALLEKINFALRVNKINHSNLDVEKIWFIKEVNSIINNTKK